MHVNEEPPLLRWSLISADCISNLRAVLDHLVYAVATCESGIKPPVNEAQLSFPIVKSRAKFDDAVEHGALGDISDPVRALIETFQPYNRSHTHLPPLLQILRDLNNADKHRLLRLVYVAMQEGKIDVTEDSDNPIPPNAIPGPLHGTIQDGAEILAITSARPAPNMR